MAPGSSSISITYFWTPPKTQFNKVSIKIPVIFDVVDIKFLRYFPFFLSMFLVGIYLLFLILLSI